MAVYSSFSVSAFSNKLNLKIQTSLPPTMITISHHIDFKKHKLTLVNARKNNNKYPASPPKVATPPPPPPPKKEEAALEASPPKVAPPPPPKKEEAALEASPPKVAPPPPPKKEEAALEASPPKVAPPPPPPPPQKEEAALEASPPKVAPPPPPQKEEAALEASPPKVAPPPPPVAATPPSSPPLPPNVAATPPSEKEKAAMIALLKKEKSAMEALLKKEKAAKNALLQLRVRQKLQFEIRFEPKPEDLEVAVKKAINNKKERGKEKGKGQGIGKGTDRILTEKIDKAEKIFKESCKNLEKAERKTLPSRGKLLLLQDAEYKLDDWVLCRIYNKKGSVEKQQQKTNIIKPPEYLADVSMEEEDKKTEGLFNTTAAAAYGGLPPVPPVSDFMYFGACDSIPRLYTDSSCSEQVVVSPEFTSEAQSEPEWKISTNNAPEEHYNYIDPSLVDNSGPFGSQFNGGEPLCGGGEGGGGDVELVLKLVGVGVKTGELR
ncbi:hypothetical protein ACFE04_031597 [Oxalis oulophora]